MKQKKSPRELFDNQTIKMLQPTRRKANKNKVGKKEMAVKSNELVRLIQSLRSVGWTDTEIVDLLLSIST